MKSSLKHALIRIACIIVGITLLLSGIFKLMDPVGTGLIVDGYWEFFRLPFLSPLSKSLGWCLSLLEASVGCCLVTGVFRRFSSWAATLMIIFFTFITLLLWIFNPPMDCGCFGRVIQLSHGASLLKNLLLLAFCCGVVLPFRGGFSLRKRRNFPAFILLESVLLAGAFYALLTIPLIDFTEFKAGTELLIGEGGDVSGDNGHELVYIYEKDGIERSFALDGLPDESWQFVRTEAASERMEAQQWVLLPISDEHGIGRERLSGFGHVMIFSVYRPFRQSLRFWQNSAKRIRQSREAGFTPLLLIAGGRSELEAELKERKLDPDLAELLLSCCYSSDYKSLVSLNRAEGGATWFYNGMLVCKWSRLDFPQGSQLSAYHAEDPVKTMLETETVKRIGFDAFLLVCLAIALLV